MNSDHVIRTIEYKGYSIHDMQDNDANSPRENDNFGKMVCWHNQYNLGDEQPTEDYQSWVASYVGVYDELNYFEKSRYYDNFAAVEAKFHRENVVLPLYLYDHSGISMRTSGFNDPWDSGQVGFIYVSRADIRKEYGNAGEKNIAKARELLRAEVKEYDDYLTGNVHGYIVENQDGEHIDSCWGFIGDTKYMLDQAKSAVDYYIAEKQKAADELQMRMTFVSALEA